MSPHNLPALTEVRPSHPLVLEIHVPSQSGPGCAAVTLAHPDLVPGIAVCSHLWSSPVCRKVTSISPIPICRTLNQSLLFRK
ncbi:hypothetical protein XELAEV_18002970mg [Xenopus laevis]|uniref:Uncharacterized protein n=1 Tax=Xenopus laevis TaxID=8355 RepID=A0A974BNL4_XENLA|nr:hypothetical protein XELAEV_18002970mg [Xenopus laevis]